MLNTQKTEQCQKFVETIPFDELFSHIKTSVGLPTLNFTINQKEDYKGDLYLKFESQNITDQFKLLEVAFKEFKIVGTGDIIYDEDTDTYSLKCKVGIEYKSYGNGENGLKFLDAYYVNRTWDYDLYR